jgi:hypothetical protein
MPVEERQDFRSVPERWDLDHPRMDSGPGLMEPEREPLIRRGRFAAGE